jgi:hypothetical protein
LVGRAIRSGGGIYNGGTLVISRSTINNNGGGLGAGVYNDVGATLTITNSTFSGNDAHGSYGGAINNQEGKTLTMNNSTISGNNAAKGAGVYGAARLQNSIVANNTGGNCFYLPTSNGYNLSSDATCAFGGPGDMNNTDPMLGPLQNNGGPTQTMALQEGSPAIDAGKLAGCTDGHGHPLKTDQRGFPRPDKEDTGGCDMGAYESQTQTNLKEGQAGSPHIPLNSLVSPMASNVSQQPLAYCHLTRPRVFLWLMSPW